MNPQNNFQNLGVAPRLLEALTRLRFTKPTPIQEQAIPVAIGGKDVVGIAQTGTGKTLAFGVPMIQQLMQGGARGLIMVPTRELALQVEETLQKVCREFGMRTAVLIGGTSIRPQIAALSRSPRIIVATPGRLIDHLEQKTIQLNDARIVVLDEADRMLDMGFAPQIQNIFRRLPVERQTMLFSATMPHEIMRLARAYMKLPIRIEVAPAGTTVDRVTQEFFILHREEKPRLLDKLLAQYQGTTLIFTRTKFGAKRLMRSIHAMGHSAAELHSNRSLAQRRDALEGFKSGRYRVLVATDIAARGIDVVGIGLVVNYDLPGSSEDYVHRIGRTARAGAGGHAISFAAPEERGEIRRIERLIGKDLPISPIPELPPARPSMPYIREEEFRPQYRGAPRGNFGRSQNNYRGGSSPSRPAFGSRPQQGSSRPFPRRRV